MFEVIATVPQSAWTPILAPLAAAGLTTINQPQIDKAGAAEDPHERSMVVPRHERARRPDDARPPAPAGGDLRHRAGGRHGLRGRRRRPRPRGVGDRRDVPGRRLPLHARPRPLRRHDGGVRARRRALVRHRQPHRPAGRVGGRRGAGRAPRVGQVQVLARHPLRRRDRPRRARLRAAARAAQALQVAAEAGRGGQRAAAHGRAAAARRRPPAPSTSPTRWATRRWR